MVTKKNFSNEKNFFAEGEKNVNGSDSTFNKLARQHGAFCRDASANPVPKLNKHNRHKSLHRRGFMGYSNCANFIAVASVAHRHRALLRGESSVALGESHSKLERGVVYGNADND